ncbi:MAG: fumarylacetoacetate hydrolase family protein [Phycisphaerales bacterium]|nr:fumarylacetoacetate hydrolase family protein [Phycisphaerales bacterium]
MNHPPAIWCIGRNYGAHAHEMGDVPKERPTVFFKNPASVIADGDAIILPPICDEHGPQVDFEGELAVILERDLRDACEDEVLEAVSYAPGNDVSARWWQREGSNGQWNRGKSFDTFCPIGTPVPAAQVPDPQCLRLVSRHNGRILQEASTADMLFPVATLLTELSRGTTLLAGTVLMTGTPGGVGSKRTPPIWLENGDVCEVEIEGVGLLTNPVRHD